MKGGAGQAHRWCGKEDALPDLPLIICDNQGHFTADPQSVAEFYAKEWKREWSDEDTIGLDKETSSIRDLRVKHVAETHEWARNLDFSAASVRKDCLSFPSKTAIGLDQHAFKDIAPLPDNALGSLGEIIRQCFVQLAIPTQSLYNFWSCWARKWREQIHRHLAHNIPSHQALGISTHQSMG